MKGLVGEINKGERSGDWLGLMNLSEGGLWTLKLGIVPSVASV